MSIRSNNYLLGISSNICASNTVPDNTPLKESNSKRFEHVPRLVIILEDETIVPEKKNPMVLINLLQTAPIRDNQQPKTRLVLKQ